MFMSISGSDFQSNPILGSLHFYQNGELNFSLIDDHENVSASDISALVVTTEFIMYALERDDWFLEYAKSINDALQDLDLQTKKKKFKVIEGGLGEEEKHK